MAGEAGLEVQYIPLAGGAPAGWDDVLGIAAFERAPHPGLTAEDVPVAEIRTPVLGSAGDLCEVWRIRQRVESGQISRMSYRRGADILFGCISLHESEFDPGETSALEAATRFAYREIFASLDALACPNLLRIWNYLPQINLDTHGMERYRQFNSARRAALMDSGRDVGGNVPAACALGSVEGSPLVVYFLASRLRPTVIENPRQVSAYEYPPQYGPRPAFSRASVLSDDSADILFISGTASIVGHETVHIGDVKAQTDEILVNIEALLGEANRVRRGARFALDSLDYKVYVRNASDFPLIQDQLRAALGSQARAVYLQADICREDLLVEIEAIGRKPD